MFRAHAPHGTTAVFQGDRATKEAICRASQASGILHLATHGFFQPAQVRSVMDATGANGRGGLQFVALAAPSEAWTDQSQAVVLPPGAMSGLALSGADRAIDSDGVMRGSQAGILTAFEVGELDLERTDLVVLSACQTGLGDVAGGEGVLGLQRAFQLAGARTVVASLWKVDDDATRALMTEFYRRLWDGNHAVGKLEALRQAQRTIRDRYRVAAGRVVSDAAASDAKPANRTPPFFWAAFNLSGDWR